MYGPAGWVYTPGVANLGTTVRQRTGQPNNLKGGTRSKPRPYELQHVPGRDKPKYDKHNQESARRLGVMYCGIP